MLFLRDVWHAYDVIQEDLFDQLIPLFKFLSLLSYKSTSESTSTFKLL